MREGPPWDAGTLLSFSGESWEAPFCFLFVLLFVAALCVSVFFSEIIFFSSGDTSQQAESHEERSRIKPMKYANGGQAFSRPLPF